MRCRWDLQVLLEKNLKTPSSKSFCFCHVPILEMRNISQNRTEFLAVWLWFCVFFFFNAIYSLPCLPEVGKRRYLCESAKSWVVGGFKVNGQAGGGHAQQTFSNLNESTTCKASLWGHSYMFSYLALFLLKVRTYVPTLWGFYCLVENLAEF